MKAFGALRLALAACSSGPESNVQVGSAQPSGAFAWLVPAPPDAPAGLEPVSGLRPGAGRGCRTVHRPKPVLSSSQLELSATLSVANNELDVEYMLVNGSDLAVFVNDNMEETEAQVDYDGSTLILKRQLASECEEIITESHHSPLFRPLSSLLEPGDALSGTMRLVLPLSTNYWPRIVQLRVDDHRARGLDGWPPSVKSVWRPVTVTSVAIGIGVSRTDQRRIGQLTVFTSVAIPPTTIYVESLPDPNEVVE